MEGHLGASEERALITGWIHGRDVKALHKLVLAFTHLVRKQTAKYNYHQIQREDISQEAITGLIRAINRFDLSKNVRLSTYARWEIRAAIKSYLAKNLAMVRYPPNVKFRKDISLDEETKGAPRKIDLIEDNSPNPEELSIISSDTKKRAKRLNQAVGILSSIEKSVIFARFISTPVKGISQLEIELGMSPRKLKSCERRALRKMRNFILHETKLLKCPFLKEPHP